MVHSTSGISRSAAIVIAYVMVDKRVNFETAHRYVQSLRFCIHPNENFKRQLMEFEPIFQAQVPRIILNEIHFQRGSRKFELY